MADIVNTETRSTAEAMSFSLVANELDRLRPIAAAAERYVGAWRASVDAVTNGLDVEDAGVELFIARRELERAVAGPPPAHRYDNA